MSQILKWASGKKQTSKSKIVCGRLLYTSIYHWVFYENSQKCLVQAEIINHVVNRSSQKWTWHLKRARSSGCDPYRSGCTLLRSLQMMMSTLSAGSTHSSSRVGMLEGRRTCHSEDTIGPASQWQSIACAENAGSVNTKQCPEITPSCLTASAATWHHWLAVTKAP